MVREEEMVLLLAESEKAMRRVLKEAGKVKKNYANSITSCVVTFPSNRKRKL